MADITFWRCDVRRILETRLTGEASPKGCTLIATIKLTKGQLAILQNEHKRLAVTYAFGYVFETAYTGSSLAIGDSELEPLAQQLYDAAVEARTRDGR